MTEVFASKMKGNYSIVLEGHATGSTEVCAGISALAFTFAGYLENYSDDFTSDMEPGKSVFRCKATDETRVAFRMLCIGLLQLEKSYPKFIKCNIGENIFY